MFDMMEVFGYLKEKLNSFLASRFFYWVLRVLLVSIIVCIFVPFLPLMPGVDTEAWRVAINFLVAQKLAFGRDVIYTFGPYASIFTRVFHPATDNLMVFGSLYLALSLSFFLLYIIKDSSWNLVLLMIFILVSLIFPIDALLFFYVLITGIICFKVNKNFSYLGNCLSVFFVILAFFSLGLILLIKGSALILCTILLVLVSIFFTSEKKYFLLAPVWGGIASSLPFFWILSGQKLINLPKYFSSMLPMIFGYSAAMSSDGSLLEVGLYLIGSLSILIFIYLQKSLTLIERGFLFLVFSTYLFLAFKEGFVRHDLHALTAASSLIFAALLLTVLFYSRFILLILIFSVFTYASVEYNNSGSFENVLLSSENTYLSSFQGIKLRLKNKQELNSRYLAGMASIRKNGEFPSFSGTTDIYSSQQSDLNASNNRWSPRPVFQSYAAYSPWLAEKNKQYLLGVSAPDNIIFRIEPLDDRFPSLEDGASWPILLSHYKPTGLNNDFL